MSEVHLDSSAIDLRNHFPIGAVISRPLAWPMCVYRHLGIYLGNGRVAHFNGTKIGDRHAVIKIDDLETFARGQVVRLEKAPRSPEHAREICGRALDAANNHSNAWNGRYSFLFRNCESFVEFCTRESPDQPVATLPGQVQKTANALAVGAVALSFVLRRGNLAVALSALAATAAYRFYVDSRSSQLHVGEVRE